MKILNYSVRDDATGMCLAHGSEIRPDLDDTGAPLDTGALIAHVASYQPAGTTVVDLDAPGAVHPDHPKDPSADKLAQLAALRAKGWANLTPDEQTTARALAFDLGQYAPG